MQVQKSFKGQSSYGTLYLVPTPIGNLQDMTFRSVQILKEVDLICAEDTRNTGLLLKHFEIETKQPWRCIFSFPVAVLSLLNVGSCRFRV